MNKNQYIKEIVKRSCLPKTERKRLKNDLENEINSELEHSGSIDRIIERMGEPDEVAAGIYENFSENPIRPFKEYKSKQTLFGLPLVHIIRINSLGVNYSGKSGESYNYYNLPTACGVLAIGQKAKGIISIGNLSAGLISIGNLSAGLISIGNLSAGIFTIGNLAIAILFTLGNIAAGLISAGNMAFGYAAAGNLAVGKYAVGNLAEGLYAFSISDLSLQLDELKVFLSDLNVSAPIRMFFKIIESYLHLLNDSYLFAPIIIITGLLILLAIIIIPNIISKKLCP